MDDDPTNFTGHLISPKKQVQRIPGQFVSKTCNLPIRENLI